MELKELQSLSLKKLKEMAVKLSIPGYTTFKSATKDKLAKLIYDKQTKQESKSPEQSRRRTPSRSRSRTPSRSVADRMKTKKCMSFNKPDIIEVAESFGISTTGKTKKQLCDEIDAAKAARARTPTPRTRTPTPTPRTRTRTPTPTPRTPTPTPRTRTPPRALAIPDSQNLGMREAIRVLTGKEEDMTSEQLLRQVKKPALVAQAKQLGITNPQKITKPVLLQKIVEILDAYEAPTERIPSVDVHDVSLQVSLPSSVESIIEEVMPKKSAKKLIKDISESIAQDRPNVEAAVDRAAVNIVAAEPKKSISEARKLAEAVVPEERKLALATAIIDDAVDDGELDVGDGEDIADALKDAIDDEIGDLIEEESDEVQAVLQDEDIFDIKPGAEPPVVRRELSPERDRDIEDLLEELKRPTASLTKIKSVQKSVFKCLGLVD